MKNPKRQPDAARRAKLTIQRRTLALLLVFGVVSFAALFAKAYDLTINQSDDLQKRAAAQQTRSTSISASRGTIYDRSGNIMAISATADTVFLDPNAIENRARELERKRAEKMVEGLKEGEVLPMTGEAYKDLIATELSRILEMDEETIRTRMGKTQSQYEILKKRVEKEVGDQIRSFITDNATGESIRGVHLQVDAKRYYPYSSVAAHVLGFLNSDNQGAYGLEAIYNEELEGDTGLVVTAKDANGGELMFQYEQYYDAEDGHSLELTIDRYIQYRVEQGLEDMVARFGAKNGATGIVMDVNTGGLLAIASSPTYDLMDHHAIYDEALQAELAKTEEENPPAPGETRSEAYTNKLGELQLRQWRNKAVNDTYEPGSTAKILTLSMALEEGSVNRNSTFNCSGSITVADYDIGCSNKAGHGHQTLIEAVGHSCNPAFVNIGLSVGTDRFYDYMEAFGLMEPTGVDLQGDVGGIFAARERFTTLDLACYAFGQNYNITPLQIITAQAACINGGYLRQPYVVEKELDGDGNVVKQHDSTPIRQVISEETSAQVREMLEYVVAEGTGKNGQVAGYRVGGKTGTADKSGTKDPITNPQGDIVVSFLCFAPADDPQIIMLLTLDTPRRDTGTYPSGGNMVAPTASAIMADILPRLGIAPQYTEDQLSDVEATVPYVVGEDEASAAAKLAEYGFANYRTVGEGAEVTDQTPAGGAIVPANAEIILYMGEEKSTELAVVPNVVGMTPAEVNRALVNAGLILKSTGAAGESGVKAISQSLPPDTQTAQGTVVTVQMGQTSTTAD